MISRRAFIPIRLLVASVLVSPAALSVEAATAPPVKRGVLQTAATVGVAQAQAAVAQGLVQGSTLLRSLPVSGILSDGGVFSGNVTITSFTYVDGKGLSANGTLSGSATTIGGTTVPINAQAFTEVSAPLVETILAAAPTGGLLGSSARQILQMDLGPIALDGGVQADLSAVAIDVTSLTGVDATLGSLLWTVAGLLNPLGLLMDVLSFLPLLNVLLGLVNGILGTVV